MISNRKELRYYMEADLKAAGLAKWKWWFRLKYPVLHWQRSLRRLELLTNTEASSPLFRAYVKFKGVMFLHHSIKFGFSIPVNVFGPGLSVAHWGTIVVNNRCKIGANCRIHPGTSLGEKDGAAPTLGESCYIGPGAKLFGGIILGNNVQIGSNAVVNRSFADGAILVGVPANNINI